MKRVCALLLLLSVAAACRKPATGTTGTPAGSAGAPATSAAPAQPGQPGQPTQSTQPPAVKPVPAQLPAVVAKVNGEAIERWELESAIKSVEARAGSPVPPEKRDEVVRGVLDQLVNYHAIAQEGKALKVDVADADVTARIAQIKQGFPNEEAFQQAMKAQGLTLDQLQKQTRMGLEIGKIVDTEISPKVTVQDSDVGAFYTQNQDRFKQGESVHASHILFAVPQNADPAQKAAARTKAQAALKQVRGGADFAKVAREQSQDTGSAQNGGDLGFFPKGQMAPTFEAAAFALKPGGISNLVETPFGFHIIKLQERRAPRTAPLAEVSGQIKQFLTERDREAKFTQFVEQAKAKRKIEILV